LNRNLAVLGATKSIENARGLLGDSRVLLSRERYGTSYALTIFALEEIAKAFVFHWVADGNLDETDLRKLIYSHRSKHATVHLTIMFEATLKVLLPKLKAWMSGDSDDLQLDLSEFKDTYFRVLKDSKEYMRLLIHAQQRRETSLYVGICDKCNAELLGPWLITRPDLNELMHFTEEHLARIDALIRNCKRHELGIGVEIKVEPPPKQPPFRSLVNETIKALDRAAKTECEHVLCSKMKRSPQRNLSQ